MSKQPECASSPAGFYGEIVLNRPMKKTDIEADVDCVSVNKPLPNKELSEQNGNGEPKQRTGAGL